MSKQSARIRLVCHAPTNRAEEAAWDILPVADGENIAIDFGKRFPGEVMLDQRVVELPYADQGEALRVLHSLDALSANQPFISLLTAMFEAGYNHRDDGE